MERGYAQPKDFEPVALVENDYLNPNDEEIPLPRLIVGPKNNLQFLKRFREPNILGN